jgi:hypothetical protein
MEVVVLPVVPVVLELQDKVTLVVLVVDHITVVVVAELVLLVQYPVVVEHIRAVMEV